MCMKIHTNVHDDVIHLFNENEFSILVNFAQYGWPELGIFRVEAGESLSLSGEACRQDGEEPERPLGYARQREEKVPCEGRSSNPRRRRFENARARGEVDIVQGH